MVPGVILDVGGQRHTYQPFACPSGLLAPTSSRFSRTVMGITSNRASIAAVTGPSMARSS
ncbi:Uncharacterised protein [Mycobacteroides abscessus subsp. massiliense]|nr:Uncharacterised protein [Mycobacteroides abscessus subsp. massiliense]